MGICLSWALISTEVLGLAPVERGELESILRYEIAKVLNFAVRRLSLFTLLWGGYCRCTLGRNAVQKSRLRAILGRVSQVYFRGKVMHALIILAVGGCRSSKLVGAIH
ncbi:hypothetical protein U2A404210034 [Corynebacterium striatum]|nr:hypothetical protein U2A404210034 [Corynebacterium striatum]